jgi:hypothetical protein
MNGTPVILAAQPVFSPEQKSCIELLADALEEANKGRITSVALVVCMDDGIATVMAGKNGGALNIGCDDLKKKIHAAMFEDGNVARKRSNILKVR